MNPLIAEASLLLPTQMWWMKVLARENGENYFLSVMVNDNSVSWSVMDRKRK